MMRTDSMSKRFLETTIWTQNKWFRKLSPKYKLFWIYLICNCDSVGVWEEDFELASFIIGEDYDKESTTESLGDKIKWINGKKLWIIDFCNFQYGVLNEENTANKPHQSYISLLKKHSLWIDYTKTIQRDKDKEKDKDIDIDKEEEKKKYKELFNTFRLSYGGTKRGLDTEFDNFIKKNDIQVIDLLLPALEKEIRHRNKLQETKQFCPEWKNLQTWINKKCWEQEFPDEDNADVKLGVGERFENGKRTYGTNGVIVPNDASPRPSEQYIWSKNEAKWKIQ